MASEARSNLKDPYLEIARYLPLSEIGRLALIARSLDRDFTIEGICRFQSNEERINRLKEMVKLAPINVFRTLFELTQLSVPEQKELLRLAIREGRMPATLAYLLDHLAPDAKDSIENLLRQGVRAGNISSVSHLLARLTPGLVAPLVILQLQFFATSIAEVRISALIQSSSAFQHARNTLFPS